MMKPILGPRAAAAEEDMPEGCGSASATMQAPRYLGHGRAESTPSHHLGLFSREANPPVHTLPANAHIIATPLASMGHARQPMRREAGRAGGGAHGAMEPWGEEVVIEEAASSSSSGSFVPGAHGLQCGAAAAEPAAAPLCLVLPAMPIAEEQAQPQHSTGLGMALATRLACAAVPKAVPAHHWEVLLASVSPRILLIENFISREMCEALVALAQPRLTTSRVSKGVETKSRTSRGTFFTGESANDPLLLQFERLLNELVQSPQVIAGKRKLAKTEALQVVHYQAGEMYLEHYDNKAGTPISRSATAIVYLRDPPKGHLSPGGATYFARSSGLPAPGSMPDPTPRGVAGQSQALHGDDSAPRPGLRVFPAAGRCILFWSALPDGNEDYNSIHSAEVVEAGEKWIMTRWFKEA